MIRLRECDFMPRAGNGATVPPRGTPYADEATIMRAWEDFLAGVDSHPPVRNVVVNSWRRSMESGVNAHGASAPLAVRDDGLHHLRIQTAICWQPRPARLPRR